MKRFDGNFSLTLMASLTAVWLLLNQTIAPAQIVLGATLGVALAWAGSQLRPVRARLRRLDIAAMLVLVVLRDILRSNVNVARIVLGLAGNRQICSGFVEIPLELRDPHGLAALAVIITSTPGTVWAGVSADGTLTLHVLDLRSKADLVNAVKQHYESALRRIFE